MHLGTSSSVTVGQDSGRLAGIPEYKGSSYLLCSSLRRYLLTTFQTNLPEFKSQFLTSQRHLSFLAFSITYSTKGMGFDVRSSY